MTGDSTRAGAQVPVAPALTRALQVGGGKSPKESEDSDNSSSDSEDNNFQVANLDEVKAEVEAAEVEAAEVKKDSTETKVKEEGVNKRKKETLLSPVTKKKQKNSIEDYGYWMAEKPTDN